MGRFESGWATNERGNHREAPESSPSAEGAESGLTRRLSMATRWGGAAVAVRAGKPRMAKGPSGIDAASTTRTEALVNTGELSSPDPDQALRGIAMTSEAEPALARLHLRVWFAMTDGVRPF